MDLGTNRTVDDPGLEAGVLIAHGYRGRHDDSPNALLDEFFSCRAILTPLSRMLVAILLPQLHELDELHPSCNPHWSGMLVLPGM